jgi:hypothetical protein
MAGRDIEEKDIGMEIDVANSGNCDGEKPT